MRRIKYICYYDKIDADVKRNYTLSATNKLDYIFAALNANNIGVDIISASNCIETKFVFDGAHLCHIGENTLRLFASIGKSDSKIFRLIDRVLLLSQLLLFLIFKVKKNEEIIVYHSLGYAQTLLLAKKIRKFKIIGEIEEIYQDVTQYPGSLRKAEYDFFNLCDKYIFPTSLLNDKLNREKKPHLIIHGTYHTYPNKHISFGDNDIHIVYAGTFDPNKGGAAAAAAAAYLPSNYHIHILGFGGKKETADIGKIVKETNAKGKGKVTFDGLLSGEEYTSFLQKCQVGLSTQNPKAAFNTTSFPSKILSYMANGLRVVSIRILAVEHSNVGKYLYYYDSQEPEAIAQAIMNINFKDNYNPYEILKSLDKDFTDALPVLLSN